MWTLSAGLVSRNINNANIRLLRQLQAAASESYLCNPGSEPLTHATLSDVLAETVNKFPNRIAVKSLHENLALTYDQLLTQADALGCALRAQGLGRGDRVGIWSHNSTAWVVALVAAARAGLISVLINPVYEKSELSFCLKKTGVKSLLISNNLPNRNYYGTLAELIPGLGQSRPGTVTSDLFPELTSIVAAGKETHPGTFCFDTLVKDYARQDASKYYKEVKPEDGCIIHFTSGTTGDPKAALDSHLGVVNNTYFSGKRNQFHEEHHNICSQAPFFHALGSIVTVLGGFRHGASLTIPSATYNVKANIKAIYEEKCTAITGTPTMFVDMLAQVRGGTPPARLKVALAAGAPCSPRLVGDVRRRLGVGAVKGLYGMTESTASIFQSRPGDSIDLVADTVGYVQDHLEVKVVDENGNTVPYGTAGELQSRGYNTMICYWDEPEKTKQVLSADGWLSTGDKFTVSADGYGRVVGRLKDMIVRGGENIAPKEIEDLLNTHPDILDSQVVGVSDDRLGEEVCAVIRVKAGASVTLEHLSRHLGGKLARFKVPRLLKHIDEFPKTASGKVQKFKLTEMIESGKL